MPRPAPEPAGLGNCRICAFLETGTSSICYRCARRTIEALAPASQRCVVCDLRLKPNGTCGNPICSWDDRFFDWNYAIAMRSGVLEQAISSFKYDNKHGWKVIFGRVLVGFLDEQLETFQGFDIITASPTYRQAGDGRRYDHTRTVIEAAADEAEGRWPFDVGGPAAIVKTAATQRFVGHSWRERKEIAETELRAALSVPDPARIQGCKVLVYDDVFTDGFTLREVARALKLAGADTVCGVTLTRQPWR